MHALNYFVWSVNVTSAITVQVGLETLTCARYQATATTQSLLNHFQTLRQFIDHPIFYVNIMLPQPRATSQRHCPSKRTCANFQLLYRLCFGYRPFRSVLATKQSLTMLTVFTNYNQRPLLN